MTIILLQPDGVALSAKAHRQGRAALNGGGGGRPLGGRSGFRADTPSNVLLVSTTSWSLSACSAMIDPGASTHQGMYGWATDSSITGTPTPPDATLPRKDIYYIQVNDSSAGDGSGTISAQVEYLAGTPNASPTAPALPPRSFLIGTVTVPQVGGGSPVVVLNPARFAASGAPLPVYSAAERDALVTYDGLTVQRRDLAGRPFQTWDGSTWRSEVEFGAVTQTDTNWGYVGQLSKVTEGSGKATVTLAERISRTGSGFAIGTTFLTFIPGFVPVGFRPATTFSGWALITDGADAAAAQMWFQITTSGDLRARLDSGSTTFANNWRVHLSGNWTTA